MDDGDAMAAGIERTVQDEVHTDHLETAFVRLGDSSEQFDQRALAGAIFADERVNLAAVEVQIDAAQGLDAAKSLGDAEHGNDRRDGSPGHGNRCDGF